MSTGSIDLRLAAALSLVLLAQSCRRDVPVASVTSEPARFQLQHGRCAPVRLEWTILRRLDGVEGQPKVFIHLYQGRKIARAFDHDANWEWTAGRRWIEEVEICQSSFEPPLPDGTYGLRIGLYDGRSGKRWPLHVQGEEVAPRAYKVADVNVTSARGLPSLRFRGLWSPLRRRGTRTEGRWLHREGTIIVRGGGGSRLHLSVSVSEAPLLITYGNERHRLGLGHQTWHVPIASDEEVIAFAPAHPIPPRSRTVTIEHVAFHQ